MSAPNPPSNYRVVNESGIKKLYFDIDTDVIQTKVYLVTTTGDLLLGSTPNDYIIVSNNLVGPEEVRSQSGSGGGWGLLNNPAVTVDFGT